MLFMLLMSCNLFCQEDTGPHFSSCDDDVECDDGFVCIDQQCRMHCTRDSECGSNMVCTMDGLCYINFCTDK